MPYIIALIVIVLFIVIALSNGPTNSGALGEQHVGHILGNNQIDKKYVINNLMIVNDGKSCQIDHVLISRTGIFVVETKNYSGRIYGSEDQKEWTQVLSYGKVKYKFYNPIHQNKTHIYALSRIIGRNDCFISLIVFPKAHLYTETNSIVISARDINAIFQQYTNYIFTVDEMNAIYKKILEFKKNPLVTETDHVVSIYKMKENLKNNICPRCGKPLVLRKGRFGNFYGCSGYPQCKFIKRS